MPSIQDNTGVRVDSIYEARNLLVTRTWQGGAIDPARVDIAYDERGLRTELRRYSDLTGTNQIGRTTYGFNERGFLTDLEHRDALDAVFADYHNTFDAAGQLIQEDYNGELSDYGYDLTGQLIQALRTNGPNEFFNWDANGNPQGPGYVIGAGNRLLSDGTFNYAYDSEGTMISKTEIATGNVTTFTYDFRNRLIQVEEKTAGGILLHESAYTYDVFDRRIAALGIGGSGPQASVQVLYIYEGVNTWADFQASGALLARYLYSKDVDDVLARFRIGEGTFWYLLDRLGSIRTIIDNSGNVRNELVYSSFGQIVAETDSAIGDRFTFTGREFDRKTGLYYLRLRYYSPYGRFISQDILSPIFLGHSNLYLYAKNNPINNIDPFGLTAISERASLNGQSMRRHPVGICQVFVSFGLFEQPLGSSIVTTIEGCIAWAAATFAADALAHAAVPNAPVVRARFIPLKV